MAKPRALIVDDVVDMAETIASDLEAAGSRPRSRPAARPPWPGSPPTPADVVVTDLRMKGGDGLELLPASRPPIRRSRW